MIAYRKMRRRKGSAIAFGAALAFVLVVLGVGFLFISMYMGGAGETKNAVDAGALNMGKQALDQIKVGLDITDPSQNCFYGVTNDSSNNGASCDGNVNLRRINRVWGEALLMAINADAAKKDPNGDNSGSGVTNAQQACNGAQSISDQLATKLTTASNLYGYFTDYANRNSVRMLGKGTTVNVVAGTNWQTSLMERNDESNIVVPGTPPFNLPPGYSLDSNFTTQCTRNPIPQGGANLWFLKGYTPLTIGSQTFWQVPFQYDEKPHMVAKSAFETDTAFKAPIAWNKPVPNSFSGEGEAIRMGAVGETAVSFVFSNPRQPFNLSMPHSFLHIKVDDNKTHFRFFPGGPPPLPSLEFGPEQTYGYTTDDQTGAPMPGGGILCTTVTPDTVTVGLDVVGRNLDQIIFGTPAGDTSQLEQYMVSRINEMVGQVGLSKSAGDLHGALGNAATIGYLLAGVQDFYLYSPDGTNLACEPAAVAIAHAAWLAPIINNDPDGTETKIIDDANTVAPIFFDPIVTPDPFCSPFLQLGYGTWDKDEYWTPGTGYNGCLGRVRSYRWTNVYSLGACNPF